ncbi:hypothetical protein DFJ73DRAFT_767857 [Zopfochytrium polystomum]|nr:hypothetical protein DFJ73DRAFT_767857 [Zopfochytrium polystomum]
MNGASDLDLMDGSRHKTASSALLYKKDVSTLIEMLKSNDQIPTYRISWKAIRVTNPNMARSVASPSGFSSVAALAVFFLEVVSEFPSSHTRFSIHNAVERVLSLKTADAAAEQLRKKLEQSYPQNRVELAAEAMNWVNEFVSLMMQQQMAQFVIVQSRMANEQLSSGGSVLPPVCASSEQRVDNLPQPVVNPSNISATASTRLPSRVVPVAPLPSLLEVTATVPASVMNMSVKPVEELPSTTTQAMQSSATLSTATLSTANLSTTLVATRSSTVPVLSHLTTTLTPSTTPLFLSSATAQPAVQSALAQVSTVLAPLPSVAAPILSQAQTAVIQTPTISTLMPTSMPLLADPITALSLAPTAGLNPNPSGPRLGPNFSETLAKRKRNAGEDDLEGRKRVKIVYGVEKIQLLKELRSKLPPKMNMLTSGARSFVTSCLNPVLKCLEAHYEGNLNTFIQKFGEKFNPAVHLDRCKQQCSRETHEE